jgi:homoserine acetyltransferase
MATVAALHGLRIDMFDVVGVHTGSTDAVELATAYPDRVSRIAAEV